MNPMTAALREGKERDKQGPPYMPRQAGYSPMRHPGQPDKPMPNMPPVRQIQSTPPKGPTYEGRTQRLLEALMQSQGA